MRLLQDILNNAEQEQEFTKFRSHHSENIRLFVIICYHMMVWQKCPELF